MSWTALLPIKARGARKTRLAGMLGEAARDDLTDRMLDRVIGALASSGQVGRVAVLSPDRCTDPRVEWLADAGRGLNVELAAADAALGIRPLLILLPDLPLVTSEDVAVLLAAADERGVAFAFDRHGRGTNAIALADNRRLRFHFGVDSRRRFRTDAGGAAVDVARPGLAWDCDTPEDMAMTDGIATAA